MPYQVLWTWKTFFNDQSSSNCRHSVCCRVVSARIKSHTNIYVHHWNIPIKLKSINATHTQEIKFNKEHIVVVFPSISDNFLCLHIIGWRVSAGNARHAECGAAIIGLDFIAHSLNQTEVSATPTKSGQPSVFKFWAHKITIATLSRFRGQFVQILSPVS